MRRIIWASAIFLSLLLLFLLFYRPKPLTVRKELEAQAELHKVKRITQKQVETEAMGMGDKLVKSADSLLLVRLAAAFKTGGVAEALRVYPPQAYPEVQALAQQYGAKPARLAQQLTTAANAGGQIRQNGSDAMLYTKPIFIRDALCLKCHGTVGRDLSEADLATIKKAHPAFKAVGFKAGDAIGSWQIELQRQAILKNLSLQSRRNLQRR